MQLEVLKNKKSLKQRDLVQITPSCSELFIRSYLPMQNLEKIVDSISGVEIVPVMAPRAEIH